MAIDAAFEQSLIDEFLFVTANITHGLGHMTPPVMQAVTRKLQTEIERIYAAGFADGQAGAEREPPMPNDPTAGLTGLIAQQAQVLWQMVIAAIARSYGAGYQDGMAATAAAAK